VDALALWPEPRPKPEGRRRAVAREAVEPRRTEFDLQGQPSVRIPSPLDSAPLQR
jgi:hypothetical protein